MGMRRDGCSWRLGGRVCPGGCGGGRGWGGGEMVVDRGLMGKW